MDAIARKLTQLLDSDDLELRKAAVLVMPELGIASKSITQALARCLREPNEELRIAALKGLARLGAKDVAHMVVPLVLTSGALREQAMAVISAVGPSVIPQLKLLYPQADFHGKRSVITTLARVGSKPSLAYLLEILPTEPFELQKHLTIHICEAIDRLAPAAQAQVFPLVQKLVRAVQGDTSQLSVLITGAIILGHFRSSQLALKARATLRSLADASYAPEVRRHALVSFNRLMSEAKLASVEEQFIFKMLGDEDWHNVAQHALTGLQRLEFPRTQFPKLIGLLHDSPHFSVHIHVFERLQSANRADIAQAILPFLSDSRYRVREAAETALRNMPTAIESLFAVLVKADDLEVTQRINSILKEFPLQTRKKFLDRACQRLINLFDHNDPHYRSFLDFIRSVDPEPLRKRLYDKVKKLKRSRSRDRWERMAACLQLLWDNHLITAEGRYLLTVAHLRLSNKELAPASRRANLGLQVIRALIYDDGEALVKRLIADKDLTAEEYFYLGFHFAEEGSEMRAFATAMLEHVLKKYPRTRVGGPAMHKLQLLAQASTSEEEKTKPRRVPPRKPSTGKTSQKPMGRSRTAPPSIRMKKGGKAAAKKASKKPAKAAKKSPAKKTKASKKPAKAAKKSPAKKTKASKKPAKVAKKSPAKKTKASKKSARGKVAKPAKKAPAKKGPRRRR